MTESDYTKQQTKESRDAILQALPYMESDDRRRALRTLRYLNGQLRGEVVRW